MQIDIGDPKKALAVLQYLDPSAWADSNPSSEECYKWIEELKWKIEEAILKESENTWKHLSSFDTDAVYPEINEFGEVRVNDKIYKPEHDDDPIYKPWGGWFVAFKDKNGHEIKINPIHFVKVHFDKDLEL